MREATALRRLLIHLLALAALGALAPAAGATLSHNPRGKLLGIVLKQGSAAQRSQRDLSGNLDYHNGPVVHVNHTHAIYWMPSGFSFPTGYAGVINAYFANVAADSGGQQNVYSTDAQYTDSTGNAAYDSTFAGAVTATNAYPANGCTPGSGYTKCLTDAQLQAEINTVINANSLPRGINEMYFIFTPAGVDSCTDGSSITCASNFFCAYHSDLDGADQTLYANEPYGDVPGCATNDKPNANPADATLDSTSHEHNEAVTDPLGTGWFDNVTGDENGDKCVHGYGSPLGGGIGATYNQVINDGHYSLQREWSNLDHACIQRKGGNASPVASLQVATSPVFRGHPVAFNAGGSHDPDGSVAAYAWAFGDGATATGPTPRHTYATLGPQTVTLTVTDNNGATGTTSQTVVVLNSPPRAQVQTSGGTVLPGHAVSFDGGGSTDVDGAVAAYRWDFGDGTTAAGAQTTHAFAAPGAHTVTLTVTDNDGSATSATTAVTVRDPHVSIRSLALSRSVFAAGRSSTALTARTLPRGTLMEYSLSADATVTISITRSLAGARRGGACVPRTRALRHARRCTRPLPKGSLTRAGTAGDNTTVFSGRIGSLRLAPGGYRVTLRARVEDGPPSASRSATFTILRG